jgi:hypothetical protein
MTRRLPWALVALAACGAVGAVVLYGPVRRASSSPELMNAPVLAAIALGAIVLSVLGALIVRHQSRNTIGWTFLAAGAGLGIVAALDQYVFLAHASPGGGGGFPTAALWVYEWAPIPVVWLPVFAILLLFPHGQPLSRRWAVVWWVAGGAIIGQALLGMIAPGPLMGGVIPSGPDNPLGVPALEPVVSTVGSLFWVLVSACLAAAAASMVVRYRRSVGIERQQLKWLAYSASLVIAGIALQMTLGVVLGLTHPVLDLVVPGLVVVGIASLPVSATIAILRFRLWEIDRLVGRTIAYAVAIATLTFVYAGSVIALQAVLPTGGSDLAVAASTLAVAAAFRPVTTHARAAVARRFDRERFDATRTVEAFGQRLRDEVDLGALTDELREVTQRVVRPRLVMVWLQEDQAVR